LAARLRRLTAGARGERGLGAAPARRVRRGARRALPDAAARRRPRRRRVVVDASAPRLAGGGLAPARRRHLGGARPEPALHALEGDGLGRVRPRRPRVRGVRARRARRAVAGRARRDPRAGARAGVVRDEAGVRPVVRLRSPRRERAPHAARRLPARPGRAGRLHGRRHPAGAVRGRAPAPLPQRGGGRRRPAGRRRRLPALLVLARAGARPAGADERGAGAVRAPPRPPQRRRAVGGGVRPGRQAAARQLPAGVHPPRARRHRDHARRGAQHQAHGGGRAASRTPGTTSGALILSRAVLKGLMQDFPLTLDLVLRRALELGGEVDVVSATPAGIDRRSWRELGERALRLGGVLDELGVPAGGRVGTFAWNGHRHVELFLGAPCAGRVVHAVNVRLTGDQIVHLTGHAGDDVLFVDASLTGLLAPLRERLAVREIVVMEDGAPVHEAFAGCRRYEELLAGQEASWKPRRPEEGDAAWICHTSGTTGCPKAVVSSHRSVVLHSLASLQVDSHGVSRQDTVLPITPMFHANAWGMPYTAALAAARLVLPGGDASPEALAQLVEAERVTIAAGVPTVFIRMLEAFDGGRDLSSLRRVLVGGAPPPRSLVAELVRRGIEFMQGWGMTEMSPSGTALTVRPGAELGG